MKIKDCVTGEFHRTPGVVDDFIHYRGKWLVLYFYPKDSTPGCTLEGQDFKNYYGDFVSLNTEILGVSRDSIQSHVNFKKKFDLPFELISDCEEHLCHQMDVIRLKSMYGKQVRGIERSTFLIDPEGLIQQIWHKVKVANHVAEVLQTLKMFQK